MSEQVAGRKKTSLDEDFGEYVLRNLMLACSHWSGSRNVDGTMNLAESELAAAFEARAREGIKELAAALLQQEADKDGERLDKLQALTRGYGNGWKLRDSSERRGMRLHETSQDGAHKSVRDAIDAYVLTPFDAAIAALPSDEKGKP